MSAASKKNSSIPLQRLVLTENGFVFNPTSGQTFTVNETGLLLLRLFQEQKSIPAMVRKIRQLYDVEPHRAKHDILQFTRFVQDTMR
ncbi:MAG: PqqD family protein [Gammaproteobacteria bacterium]|nr:PqqD family protein [Gammaproteobacteria bacterium]